MSNPVIQVKGLSKKYRIGKIEKRADTLATAILKGLKQPLENLKQIRNLSRLDQDQDSIYWALRDVSFDVHEGEVLGIIGHNGAGKSTLLKILSRITEPSEGEVRIRGRVAALLEVGTGFHPELTGRENIYMNGTILGMRRKEIDRKLDEIVDFSGVEKYLDTPVKFYSSGMRVRLGFSVAAHLEPEILIIDEVLAVGDLEFQRKCIGKIENVSKESGRTVLFVSHNMHALSELCTRAILLNKGSVIASGEPSEVINIYTFSKNMITNRWISEKDTSSSSSKGFREIYGIIHGNQPDLSLHIYFSVDHNSSRHDCFVAFDILNGIGDSIMQALPTLEKKISDANGDTFSCLIKLQGLIPGTYYVSCWMGNHNNSTDSFVEKAITFTVTSSPTAGRTYPHTLDHGSIVPESSLLPLATEEYTKIVNALI